MRKLLVFFILASASTCLLGQGTGGKASAPKPKTSVAKKPAAKPTTPPSGAPVAVFNTTAGTMRCTLFEKETPVTVENFIGLATGKKDWKNPASGVTKHNSPLYDGTIFHRVIPDFMIQGGDPLGTGTGDPGYRFQDEFVDTLKFDRPGRLAMANSGPNTNGSQFFITEDAAHSFHLSGRHTIFGQCDDATVALVKKIARLPKGPDDKPLTPVRIVHLTIVRGGTPATSHPSTHHPVAKKPTAGTPATKPAPKPQ